MATSYSHVAGSGDRRNFVFVSTSGIIVGVPSAILNGNRTDTNCSFHGDPASGTWFQFDFQSKAIIDECTFYFSSATSQGTWQWQGSNDGTTWTNIGTSFALGASATQVVTSLNGNITGYRYYRCLGVSGTTNSGPWFYEIEFKSSDDPSETLSFLRSQSEGNRTGTANAAPSNGTVTATSSGIPFAAGNATNLVNGTGGFGTGSGTTDCWWSGTPSAGAYLEWDFGTGVVVGGIQLTQQNSASHAVFQPQGSNDNSTWTNLGSSYTLGGSTLQNQSLGNTTQYRYYRLLYVSGALSGSPFLYEFAFQIGAPPPSVFPTSDTLAAALTASGTLVKQKLGGADTIAAALTETATLVLPPAAGVSVTQDVLEAIEFPTNTQVWTTQAALEAIELPTDTKLWTTQACLEVVLSGSWCPPCPDTGPGTGGKRNHSFIGIMALNA